MLFCSTGGVGGYCLGWHPGYFGESGILCLLLLGLGLVFCCGETPLSLHGQSCLWLCYGHDLIWCTDYLILLLYIFINMIIFITFLVYVAAILKTRWPVSSCLCIVMVGPPLDYSVQFWSPYLREDDSWDGKVSEKVDWNDQRTGIAPVRKG